jgi:hypothetical protein
MEILVAVSKSITDIYKKDSVVNLAFGLSNAKKAYTGRLDGYHNPVLMTKKEKKEKQVRSNLTLEGVDPWQQLEKNVNEAGKYYPEHRLLRANSLGGKVNQVVHELYDYQEALAKKDEAGIKESQETISKYLSSFDPQLERALFMVLLQELDDHSTQGYMEGLLNGKNANDKVNELFETSTLLNDQEKFFNLSSKKIEKEPLLAFAKTMVPKHRESSKNYQRISKENIEFEKNIMSLQYELSGLSSPPDATFSLRIADGVVKGYDYNGTKAPYYTTYFGLYDRFYSHQQKFPWNLPEKWLNPPMELLKSPMNFVCTADIIGGNSGSPVINSKQEVVGLVFDGNIESLPGYFIYDNTYNRTVSVHSGGIYAALKYIYKGDRIVEELSK